MVQKNRTKIFYLLAFVPLLLIVYFQPRWPFAVISPAFGFILLALKRENLFSHKEARSLQKIIGVIVVSGSFFVNAALTAVFPRASTYNVANYALLVLGLFVAFFEISALKKAFTALLLIVAATLNSLLFDGLEPLLSPYIANFISLMSIILRTLGMSVIIQYPNIIVLNTTSESIPALFTWGCVASSSIVFCIILVVFLLEETAHLRTKLFWATIGILGTFSINIIRVTIIFLSWQFYGFETGEKIHWYLGYALFITWLALFLYMFAKRQAILGQIRLMSNRLRGIF